MVLWSKLKQLTYLVGKNHVSTFFSRNVVTFSVPLGILGHLEMHALGHQQAAGRNTVEWAGAQLEVHHRSGSFADHGAMVNSSQKGATPE